MTDSNEKLTGFIDLIVEKKLLSGEGFETITKLREHAAELEANLANLTVDLQERTLASRKKDAKIEALEDELEDLRGAHGHLLARHEALVENEKKTAVAEAVAETAIRMFETVFKPVTLRRNVQGSVPVEAGQYGTASQPTHSDETASEE
tara:strand:+ start:120 stop:569 length:450 start_codon:yes stop_codon:yes gene_type:complete